MARHTRSLMTAISIGMFTPISLLAAEPTKSVVFYALGIGLDGTVAAGPVETDIEKSASDIFDALEFGGMGSYRYQTDVWSLQVDAIYADLSGEREGDRGAARGRVELEEAMIELDFGYRVNDAVEIIGGARYWDYDAEVTVVGTGSQGISLQNGASKDWVDPLIGMRLNVPLGQHWSFVARGDVGGFGVGSDFAWHATAFFNWRVNNSVGLLFGYRAFDVEFDDSDGPADLHLDLLQSGPGVGVAIQF
jgi:hypothetical protein